MMIYIVTFIIIGVISLVGTIIAGIQVNKSVAKLDQAHPEEHSDILKANHFKSKSSNLKVLTWIYIVVFALAIIFFLLYIFLK